MFVELMQALFSTMQETAQQPMTDFRRSCLEAEEKSEFNAAPDDMDDGQQPGNPHVISLITLSFSSKPYFINKLHSKSFVSNFWGAVQMSMREIL